MSIAPIHRRPILLTLVVLAALLNLQLSTPPHVQAATLTVDDNCTLADAIIAANTGMTAGNCRSGTTGVDTIYLTQHVVLTNVDNTTAAGQNGLPLITSDITIIGNGFTIERSDAAGTPAFRIFQIEPDARLRLIDFTLRNGRVVGSNGRRGSNTTTPGSDGENGERGNVDFIISGAGGDGGDGDMGNPGGSGGTGDDARGGAILNHGTLELERCAIADSSVTGGNGGTGGNASRGGIGGEGGPPGIPIPLVFIATLGPPGPAGDGGEGGIGGTGGSGGDGHGGAIYHDGESLLISSCTFENNQALGGRGGTGGRGGMGGDGGIGAIAQAANPEPSGGPGSGSSDITLGPGGDGGKGGRGGTGGRGGDGQGGAIYHASGEITVRLSNLNNNLAQGGAGNSGGRGSNGADGELESGDGGFGGEGGTGGAGGDGQGGGIYIESGIIWIERTTLQHNRGQGGAGGSGNDAGAAGDGAGILAGWVSGLEEFTNIIRDIALNSIMSGSSIGGVGGSGGNGGNGQGGSVFIASGELIITRSTLATNQVEPGGGGTGGQGGLSGFPNEFMQELNLRLPNREVAPGGDGVNGDVGGSQGGSTYLDNAQLEILRSTFTGNQAREGGAFWLGSILAESRIISSTIAHNSARIRGGGIEAVQAFSIGSTLVAANTSPTGPDINGVIESLDYNLIGDTTGATLNGLTDRTLTNTPARIETLGNNGGPTQTMALLPGSLAINRGRCSFATDQRGYYRTDRFCDIGAYEFGASPQPPQTVPPALVGAPGLSSIRASLPAGVYTRLIASEGVFYRSPAEVGIQSLLDRGVIHAVDIFSPSGDDTVNTTICLSGAGDAFYLAASHAPRLPQPLPSTLREGFSCVWIAEPGTIVLVNP